MHSVGRLGLLSNEFLIGTLPRATREYFTYNILVLIPINNLKLYGDLVLSYNIDTSVYPNALSVGEEFGRRRVEID